MKFHGVLFFPVTPFAADGSLDEERLAQHIEPGVAAGRGRGVRRLRHRRVPRADARRDRAGHPGRRRGDRAAACRSSPPRAGRSPVARDQARPRRTGRRRRHPAAAAVPGERPAAGPGAVRRGGHRRHRPARRSSTSAAPPGSPRTTAAEIAALPGVVGLKDGIGDIERMHRIVRAVRAVPGREDFQFFNGLPTAEMTAPAYQGIGVDLYSSAVFAFAPEIALAFHRALADGRRRRCVNTLLDEFYGPLVALRDEVPGYAVSLVKAGVTLRGLDVGGVRAPLVDPTPEHLARLAKLIDHGLEVVGA